MSYIFVIILKKVVTYYKVASMTLVYRQMIAEKGRLAQERGGLH